MSDLHKRFPRYSKLLGLYPSAYRRQYGEQMLQTLADMLDNSAGRSSRAAVWLRAAVDTPLSIVQQQAVLTGRVMAHDMPHYVKRNSLVAALLLLPFFAIVSTNDIAKHHLYNTWLWHSGVLAAWIIVLPGLAFALSAGTLVAWAQQQRRQHRNGWLRSLLDIRRTWPPVALVLVGAGILVLVFLHDSTHCVAGNPFREAQEWRETLTCVRNGN